MYTTSQHNLHVCSQIVPNLTLMQQQLALIYAAGQVMWAYSLLMLLACLKDPQILPRNTLADLTIADALASAGGSCAMLPCKVLY